MTRCTIGGGGGGILPQKPYLAVQSYPIPPQPPPPPPAFLRLCPDRQSGDQERRRGLRPSVRVRPSFRPFVRPFLPSRLAKWSNFLSCPPRSQRKIIGKEPARPRFVAAVHQWDHTHLTSASANTIFTPTHPVLYWQLELPYIIILGVFPGSI